MKTRWGENLSRNLAFFVLLTLGVCIESVPLNAYAGLVAIVSPSGKKVRIETNGEAANVGDEHFIMDSTGKKIALVRVTKVGNGTFDAEVTKNPSNVTLQKGFSTAPKGGASTSNSSGGAASNGSGNRGMGPAKKHFGMTFAYLMNTMDASFTAGSSLGATGLYKVNAAMKGSTFGIHGFYDHPIKPSLLLRAVVGIDQFAVATTIATTDCDNKTSANCNVNINYLSGYGFLNWTFLMKPKWKAWVGPGFGYMYPISKSTTILNNSEISGIPVYMLALGADVAIGNKYFMPISLEYGMFPPSDNVKASMMILRFGFGW